MHSASKPEDDERPFVATSVARHLLNRLRITHEERGISVFSGPWGIGKTTAIDAFREEQKGACVIVKIEPGPERGASQGTVMKQTIEALEPFIRGDGSSDRRLARFGRPVKSNSRWKLRLEIFNLLSEWEPCQDFKRAEAEYEENKDWWEADERRRKFPGAPPPFTFIFDEAQYLSRAAIEVLRYWNDADRTTTPIPVGLVFIGNNEFNFEEVSGAVRSRALFIEQLDYADISDQDLVLFAQSRGVTDAAAIAAIVRYYSSPRIKRDLRNAERLLATLKRRSSGKAVTGSAVQELLELA